MGFFEVRRSVSQPGDKFIAELFLPNKLTNVPTTYFKYGREPSKPTLHWYEFMLDPTCTVDCTGAEFVDSDNDGRTDVIRLHLIDGKWGDDDLTENGFINDPGGPAVYAGNGGSSGNSDLELKQDGTSVVALGENATYELTVTNIGPDTAQSVVLASHISSNTSIVSITPSDQCSDTQILCEIGELSAGSEATVAIVVQAKQLGRSTNSASVMSSQSDPNPGNNLATLETRILPEVDLGEGEFEIVREEHDVVVREKNGTVLTRYSLVEAPGLIIHGVDGASQLDVHSLTQGQIVIDGMAGNDAVDLQGGTLLSGTFIGDQFFNSVDLDGTHVLTAGPHPWQNPVNPYDVDGDGNATPVDALILVNRLNAAGPSTLPSNPTPENAPLRFHFDVDANDALAPSDLLQVINFLNQVNSESEGELADERTVLIDDRRVVSQRELHSAAVVEVVATDWSDQLADNSNWMRMIRDVEPVDQLFADSELDDWTVEDQELLESVL